MSRYDRGVLVIQPMTAEEFAMIRKKLGVTQDEVARFLGYARWKTISEFEKGHRPIPLAVAALLRLAGLGELKPFRR